MSSTSDISAFITVPTLRLVEDELKASAAKLGTLDAEQKAIVERALARAAILAGMALFASDEQRKEIDAEGAAINATLSSIGGEKSAEASKMVESFVTKLIERGMAVALAALA